MRESLCPDFDDLAADALDLAGGPEDFRVLSQGDVDGTFQGDIA
jgi:hypothetical protein